MTKTLLPLAAALLLFPSLAFAAPEPAAGEGSYRNDEGAMVTETGDGTREIVIDGDETIDGEALRAGGENIWAAKHGIHASMITVRTNFLVQLTRLSADI